jgi:hypothetical protein
MSFSPLVGSRNFSGSRLYGVIGCQRLLLDAFYAVAENGDDLSSSLLASFASKSACK